MKAKIFNSEEVQAIIAGKKTMFREVIKNAIYDPPVHSYKDWHKDGWYYPIATMVDENNKEKETQYTSKAVKPKFEVGETIFVKWQEQARLNLRIKSVKVKKLQDITEDDTIKEGFEYEEWIEVTPEGIRELNSVDAIDFFQCEWNIIHKKQEHKWEANPWVFVYEFEIINL